jgi:hypothetical protein
MASSAWTSRRPQPRSEIGDAGDVPRVQDAQRRFHVGVGDRDRFGDGSNGVVELLPGVPDRVPDPVRDLHDVRSAVVQHDDVEVTSGAELAPPVAADSDESDALGVTEQAGQPGIGFRGALGSHRIESGDSFDRALAGTGDSRHGARQVRDSHIRESAEIRDSRHLPDNQVRVSDVHVRYVGYVRGNNSTREVHGGGASSARRLLLRVFRPAHKIRARYFRARPCVP